MSSLRISNVALRSIALAVGWAAAIGGALSLHHLPIDLGHGICGPWGCGAPTLTLVSCHLAWMTFLTPPILGALFRWPGWTRLVSGTMVLSSIMIIAGTSWYVHFRWLPSVGEYYQPYGWQRVGFLLATEVQYPVAEVGLVGVLAGVMGLFRRHDASKPANETEEHQTSVEPVPGGV